MKEVDLPVAYGNFRLSLQGRHESSLAATSVSSALEVIFIMRCAI